MKTVPIAVLVDGIIEIALGLDCGHVSVQVRCGEASRLAGFLLEQLELTECGWWWGKPPLRCNGHADRKAREEFPSCSCEVICER